MGFMKQMKDMKATVAAAPEMISQAQQLSANAQAMAAAQQRATYTVPTVAAIGPDFDPIAGVSLELYAEISRDLAGVGYDQTRAPGLAAAKGVGAAEWDAAVAGWNARMQTNPGVGQRFNALYTGR